MIKLSLPLLACGLLLAACTQAPRLDPQHPGPHELALQLLTSTHDGRITYIVLNTKNILSFGGGRQARIGVAKPVGTITQDDQQQILRIIAQYNLLHAPGRFMPQGQAVTYNCDLTVDGFHHHFACADLEVPGMDQLQAALIAIESRLHYGRNPLIEDLPTPKR